MKVLHEMYRILSKCKAAILLLLIFFVFFLVFKGHNFSGVAYTPANSIRPQSSNGAQRTVKSASLSSVESLDKRRQSRAQDCKSNISLFSHRTEEIRRGASVLKRADVDRYMSICGSRMYKKFCSKTVDLHLVDRKCQRQDEMRFLTQEEAGKRGLFMLASYPGSGNTWSRLILEELTGIYTGSIFCDHLIAFSGHFGEGFAVRETIAVKAHSALGRIRESPRSVIYLVRNPFHSLLSSLSWKSTKSHTISNHKESLDTQVVKKELEAWSNNVHRWVERGKWSVTVVSYDALVSDFEEELKKFVSAINFPVKQEAIDCLLHNSMDAHKRNKKKGENPYTEEQEEVIRATVELMKTLWEKHEIDYKSWTW